MKHLYYLIDYLASPLLLFFQLSYMYCILLGLTCIVTR